LARAKEHDLSPTAAASEQTGSIPDSARQSPASDHPCQSGTRDFPQVADARRSADPNPLLLRASDEVQIGNAQPAGPTDGNGGPCGSNEKPPQPAGAEPSGERPLSTELEGWTVVLTGAG